MTPPAEGHHIGTRRLAGGRLGAAPGPAMRIAGAVLLAVVALAFAAVTTVIAFRDITSNQVRTRKAVDAAFTERSAFIALIDEETGVRGYVATGDSRFLDPYAQGRRAYARVRPALEALDGPVGDAADRVEAVGDALQRRFERLVGEVAQGRRTQAVSELPAGKATFDALRREDAATFATMQSAIASAREATNGAIALARQAIIATALVLLIAGALAARLATAAQRSASLARRDAVTKLPNRRAFEERLEQMLAARRADERIGVMYVDLDRFKPVNDAFGHEAGDTVLAACGERLRHALRPGDFIARVGGDEFAAIVRGIASPENVTAIGARMLAELTAPFAVSGTTVVIGASIGTAIVPDDAQDATAAVRAADEAMYRAKRAPRT